MFHNKESLRYYLFSLSNFLAAIGGGMILGKGVATIQIPFLHGGSLLAFLVGTVIGLFFLQLTPKKFSDIFSRWFSISGGITSLILFSIFLGYAKNQTMSGNIAIVFFLLLSMRFGFWFYSRVLRAANAAGHNQNIAWVEFGYYAGIIGGLVIWLLLGIDIGMGFALLLDATLQFAAGFLDITANKMDYKENKPDNNKIQISQPLTKNTSSWSWRLAISVMLITIGVQVIIFNLSHQVPSYFSPYILAFFYFGAATSSLICKKFHIRLEWDNTHKKNRSSAAIYFNQNGRNKKLNFLLLNILSALGIFFVTYMLYKHPFIGKNIMFGLKEFAILFFIFVGTFFYGILEMAMLDRIGIEEIHSQQKNMILRTYGLMSVAAVLSLWLLSLLSNIIVYQISIILICFILTFFILFKRNIIFSE